MEDCGRVVGDTLGEFGDPGGEVGTLEGVGCEVQE